MDRPSFPPHIKILEQEAGSVKYMIRIAHNKYHYSLDLDTSTLTYHGQGNDAILHPPMFNRQTRSEVTYLRVSDGILPPIPSDWLNELPKYGKWYDACVRLGYTGPRQEAATEEE